jgi:hypothetical protein
MIIWRALEYSHCLIPVICLLMHLVPHILDSNDNGKPPDLYMKSIYSYLCVVCAYFANKKGTYEKEKNIFKVQLI